MPDPNAEPLTRQPQSSQELAGALQLCVLAPSFSEEDVARGCDQSRRNALSGIVVRPSDLDLAERWTGPSLTLAAAVDWPYGYSTTAVKQYAVRDALRRGAKEILVTMNTGKLISRQFQYLEMEFLQISEACHEVRACLTINLESHHLTNEHKIVACRIAKRVNADYIATADLADLPLLKEYARERIQLTYRAAADILPTALDLTLQAYAAGCGRIESAQAVEILEAWNAPSDSTAAQGHA